MRVVLLFLLLACSKKDDPNKLPPTGQGDIVPGAPADPAPPPALTSDNAACKLLSQEEAKALVGVDVPEQEAHTDPVGTLYCAYKNKKPYTKVELALSPRGQTMYDEQDKLGMFKSPNVAGGVFAGKYIQIMVVAPSPVTGVADALKTMTGRL